jgi:hypothetical protein
MRGVMVHQTSDPHENDPERLSDIPKQYSDTHPETPKPAPKLDLCLLAARWVVADLLPEDMPGIAADLLEMGFDTPSLRRLAGEILVHCKADVDALVAKSFHELRVDYLIPEGSAIAIVTRQIARDVIWGVRSLRSGASYIEFKQWSWRQQIPDLWTLYELNDEFDWDVQYRRPVTEIAAEMLETFARLGAQTEREKRMASLGLLSGTGNWIADDFDGPLPDDLLAQFEGREPSESD